MSPYAAPQYKFGLAPRTLLHLLRKTVFFGSDRAPKELR
jgi:hypothetical protein